MEKINFVNNSEPAINATNLNKLQQNIEEAIENNPSGDTLPINSIVDYDGNTVPDGYEEINDFDEYSTNEVKTNNIWIDGKPIYRKVLTLSSLKTGNNFISHDISNLSNLIYVHGTVKINNMTQPIPRIVTDGLNSYGIGIGDFNPNNNTAMLQIGSSYTNINDGYLILEYTKNN